MTSMAATSDSTTATVSARYRPQPFRAAMALAWREIIRFLRQRNRVIGALGQPILFWLLFGAGLGRVFRLGESDSVSFLEYYFPGTMVLIVLFTAIFATISIIEDRREGFMQSVLVAPVGRWPVLFGKVIGGSAIAWVQAVFFLGLVYLFTSAAIGWTLPALLLLLALIAIGMCSLGMIVAWPMDSTQGFHAIMMLGLMPMWLLSGTFFPIPAWSDASIGQMILGGIMRLNPLSYSMIEMRRLIYPEVDLTAGSFAPSWQVCWGVTVVAAVLTTSIAWHLMRGSRKADVIV